MAAILEKAMPSYAPVHRRLSRWNVAAHALFIALTLVPGAVRLVSADGPGWGLRALAILTAAVLAAGVMNAALTARFSVAWATFWIWGYIFLGLAPIHQIAFGSFPWLGTYSDQTLSVALWIVLLGAAVTALAQLVIARFKLASELASVGRDPDDAVFRRMRKLLTGILLAYVVVVVLFVSITREALFTGKQALSERLVENASIPGAGTLFFLATAGGIALPAIAIVARRNGAGVPVWLIVASALGGAIATNPLTGSRFLTGAFLIATVGAIVLGRGIARFLPLGIGVALITVFPSLDLLRGDGTGSVRISFAFPAQALVGFDFDAFEMLARAVVVGGDVSSLGITPFTLLIAPFIRWVPFLSRLVPDMATGRVVAEITGASYSNLSMPLWGEAFTIGGVVGVAVVFALLGAILAMIRPTAENAVIRRRPTHLIIDAPIAALLLIVLRGSLFEVLGYALFAVVIAVALWSCSRSSLANRNSESSSRPRTVAFYLPQFHAIPENDRWWGEGFTEWSNVRRAEPQYDMHLHPRVAGPLGEYNLLDVDVMHEQAALARANGIDAFCFYFYWFDGKRLLEKPLAQYLAAGPDLPFCISWANESWSRRWDGKEHEALITQEYRDTTAVRIFDDFLPLLSDPRYLRLDGAAVLLVHRSDHLPDGTDYAETWRRLADEAGVGPLHIVAAETHPGIDPTLNGFNAAVEFPPVGANTLGSAQLAPVAGVAKDFRGRLMSYPRLARHFMRRSLPPFVRYRGVVPSWDNTARRGSKATMYLGSTASRYHDWLTHARIFEQRLRGGSGFVFVNAWNEWAEGAYLEPDGHNGATYLEATRWERTTTARTTQGHSLGRPSYGWFHSVALAAAGSALQLVRRVKTSVARLTRRQ